MTLTASDIVLIDGLIAKCFSSAKIAAQLDLNEAEIHAYRTERKRQTQIARVQEARRDAPAVDQLLAALTAHMPPAGDVFAPLGRPVSIGRGMAA